MSTPVITQRYWDDVKEGEEIPGFEMFLSETKMVEQVSGSQDFYPVHHDREFARSGGHPDVFFNTGFTRAALGRLLGDYAGTEGWIRKLEYSMRKMNRPGVTLKARGKVTRKYVDDDGNGLVDFEDPACCAEAQAFAGTLRHARLKARRHGGTVVRLRGQLGGPGLAVTPASQNVFLQIRADGMGELLCAELPAGKFRKHHGAFRFRDRKHLLASAHAIDVMRLKPMPGGLVRARTVGRDMDLRMPSPGGLRYP